MTTKRIAFLDPSGELKVLWPTPEFVGSYPTEDEGIQAVISKDIPAGSTDIEVLDESQLPYRGDLRSAWKKKAGGGVEIDMAEARKKVKDRHKGRAPADVDTALGAITDPRELDEWNP